MYIDTISQDRLYTVVNGYSRPITCGIKILPPPPLWKLVLWNTKRSPFLHDYYSPWFFLCSVHCQGKNNHFKRHFIGKNVTQAMLNLNFVCADRLMPILLHKAKAGFVP